MFELMPHSPDQEGQLKMTESYLLHHYPFSPFCRKLRLALKEKGVEFDLYEERYWERRHDFMVLNPAGKVPVLRSKDQVFCDSRAICEYLEDVYPDPPLFPEDPFERYEVRRLIAWFDEKFYREVTSRLVGEKLLRHVQRTGQPDGNSISVGLRCLRFHMNYLSHLLQATGWLVGRRLSLADFTAAAHVSCVDYLGDIDWGEEGYASVKDWYAALKSRPAFRPILADSIHGYSSSSHYAVLDF